MKIVARCPICSSLDATFLYSVNSNQAAQHVARKGADESRFQQLKICIETLWHDSKCIFVRCNNCSFGYAVPYIAGDKRFYELAYDRSGGYSVWKWEYQVSLDKLQDLIAKDSSREWNLLEVGAGDGSFIKKVTPGLIPKEHVLCTEYSDYGKNEITKLGIACLQKDIRELVLAEYTQHFDVICMFQVLEHLDDLDSLFESLTRLTKEQSSLFIAVPNSIQREFYDLRGMKEDVPPTHIGKWNKRCFEVIAQRHNWIIVDHKIQPQSFVSKVLRMLSYRFVHTTWADHLERIQIRFLRKMAKLIAYGFLAISSVDIMIGLIPQTMGVSQWVYLRKIVT